MKPALLLGLLALLPAAVNARAPATLTMRSATCGGGAHILVIPVGPSVPDRRDGQPCCAKACHAGSCRKRFHRVA